MDTHHPTQTAQPVFLVLVGGIDPSVGAGVLRDLLTATARGGLAHVVGTAWTEQAQQRRIEPRDPESVGADLATAIERLRADASKSAVKIGMVATAAIARAIHAALEGYTGPVVFDPVLRASSGMSLYDGDRDAMLALARRVSLLTPNLDEAGWLLDRTLRSLDEARSAARGLFDLGVPSVLVKGGHLEGEATDTLLSAAGEQLLAAARISGPSPRGTGCTLATTIAAELATGTTLVEAVVRAKSRLHAQIEHATAFRGERHL